MHNGYNYFIFSDSRKHATKINFKPQPKISIKCQQVHSNKPMSGAGSPSCRPESVQLNLWKNMKRQTDPTIAFIVTFSISYR